MLLPGLGDDPAERSNFREMLRAVAMARRSGATRDRREAEEIAGGVNALRETSSFIAVNDTVVSSQGPTSNLPPKTVEDVLSESVVDLNAADAAEALAAAFEENPTPE
jgi:hypothetical protein